MLAGFIINCAGDNRDYSFVHTPEKNTFADEIMNSSFIGLKKKSIYEFKDRSSDERQYCHAGLSCLFVVIQEAEQGSKTYPEYHTVLITFH